MNAPSFQLKLKQTQQLTQGLQQSLRVLQLSSLELEREVEDWLQENPLLEKREPAEEALEPSHLSAAISSRNQIGGDDAEDVWATIAEEEDFNHFLHMQVCEHPLDETTAALVHILIDFLDEQGYLNDSLADIIDNTPLEWQLDEEALQIALDCLQAFDPAGVGAQNLTESLILQLNRLPASSARQCAAKIVQSHLAELDRSRNQSINILKKELPDYDHQTLTDALDLISQLNPFPAYGFAGTEPTSYIQPDVWVIEGKNGWQIKTNEAAWPQISLNEELTDALKEEGLDDTWREKLQEARQKVDSINLRKNTVLRLAEYIVKKQEDFFIFGEIGLTPMLMKDAANELDLAESTISRAANNKYLACPRGLFALRYFFTHAVSTDENGEGTSQNAIKAIIAQLIEKEDKTKPYSDDALSEQLKQQGIEIARRTVAKYRESMNIPTASRRKV